VPPPPTASSAIFANVAGLCYPGMIIGNAITFSQSGMLYIDIHSSSSIMATNSHTPSPHNQLTHALSPQSTHTRPLPTQALPTLRTPCSLPPAKVLGSLETSYSAVSSRMIQSRMRRQQRQHQQQQHL
jgi:hypothetical protein